MSKINREIEIIKLIDKEQETNNIQPNITNNNKLFKNFLKNIKK